MIRPRDDLNEELGSRQDSVKQIPATNKRIAETEVVVNVLNPLSWKTLTT